MEFKVKKTEKKLNQLKIRLNAQEIECDEKNWVDTN